MEQETLQSLEQRRETWQNIAEEAKALQQVVADELARIDREVTLLQIKHQR